MKKQKHLKMIMENKKLVDTSFGLNLNSVKIHRSESKDHFLAKALLSHELVSNGAEIITECRFIGGARADIFDMSIPGGYAYEILHSEDLKRFEAKKSIYPCPISGIKAEKVIKMNLSEVEHKKQKGEKEKVS